MRSWFVSDTHFGHSKAADFRGFANVDAMDVHMIDVWNKMVGQDDIVYHLGDFSFYGSKRSREIIEVLKGRIHLVPGNHDESLNAKTLAMFHKVLPPLVDMKFVTDHTPEGGTVHCVTLCHFPMLSWNGMHHKSFHLHGHSHGNCQYPHQNNRILDVGVDVNCRSTSPLVYGPVSLEHVLAVMENRGFTSVDQHKETTE